MRGTPNGWITVLNEIMMNSISACSVVWFSKKICYRLSSAVPGIPNNVEFLKIDASLPEPAVTHIHGCGAYECTYPIRKLLCSSDFSNHAGATLDAVDVGTL